MVKDKNRVSPANIIATISIAALGVLTFFGALFLQEDGTPAIPLIKAVGFTFLLGLLLVVCILAKTTEKEFTKWRVFEYISLAAYLIVAIAFYKPFLQFFHIVQHKGTLQEMAEKEIDAIDDLCAKYNSDAQFALGTAADRMKSYKASGQNEPDRDNGLKAYIANHAISNVDDWKNNFSSVVVFTTDSLDQFRDRVWAWNLMDLSAVAAEMNNKAGLTWDNLNTKIEQLRGLDQIPNIVCTEDDEKLYSLDGLVRFDLGQRPAPSAFTAAFRKPLSGFNIGIIVYIVLHLLALMNYVLVRRSPIIQIKKDKRDDDGGLLLEAD